MSLTPLLKGSLLFHTKVFKVWWYKQAINFYCVKSLSFGGLFVIAADATCPD